MWWVGMQVVAGKGKGNKVAPLDAKALGSSNPHHRHRHQGQQSQAQPDRGGRIADADRPVGSPRSASRLEGDVSPAPEARQPGGAAALEEPQQPPLRPQQQQQPSAPAQQMRARGNQVAPVGDGDA